MPIKDGYKAMQEIRLHYDFDKRNVAILALTAHATEGEREKCIDAGADNYLSKPFQSGQLLDMIERMTVKKEKTTKIEVHFLENFNIKTLREFTNNKQKLIISTLHLLTETITDDEKSLSAAFKNNDEKVIRSLAHRMKPNLYLLGLSRLGKLCDEICANDKTLEEVKELSSIIIKTIPTILNDIKIELKNLEKSSH